MSAATLRPIDPLRAIAGGRYEDDVVVVTRRPPGSSGVQTPHFEFWTEGGKLHVAHALPAHRIDNNLAGVLADELFGPGWVSGSEAFERVLTGVVLTSADDPGAAWEIFYRNTLDRLAGPPSIDVPSAGSLAAYAPVYAHALSLVPTGTALELACCFGFLSLQLARRATVTASDVTANTVRLLATVAPRLGRVLDTLVCDGARVPMPDRSFDTVLAVHLLEHLEPEHGAAVVAEAQRLARGRVVVAVPFEHEPAPAFGHVRAFVLDDLHSLGSASGWPYAAYEHHGGWLVLDQPVK
jgi:2-polyprenyl-3-methyl-5-hydroxy-6-metoxy-1,4-benzoquinol methylase